ncbi:MAG: hypothetical protein KatS3mg085_469 [Candidatus Dojkabacteria bacterium]|nr:MAG: hypothetical protein KatS3mg085_469 [Candidatus Dojkabacteria bacterium]
MFMAETIKQDTTGESLTIAQLTKILNVFQTKLSSENRENLKEALRKKLEEKKLKLNVGDEVFNAFLDILLSYIIHIMSLETKPSETNTLNSLILQENPQQALANIMQPIILRLSILHHKIIK